MLVKLMEKNESIKVSVVQEDLAANSIDHVGYGVDIADVRNQQEDVLKNLLVEILSENLSLKVLVKFSLGHNVF